MTAELPGVLRRLVEAQRRLAKHGTNLVDDASELDARWLAQRSDAIRLFLTEACGRDGLARSARSSTTATCAGQRRRAGTVPWGAAVSMTPSNRQAIR